ncbi:MAG: glycosyltransferase family 2 protein [Candidatus Hydrogenedentes bacterium]|nr:glycosyltransferase family 2 protein [Candidatus Hydrogenedentota bacterium]
MWNDKKVVVIFAAYNEEMNIKGAIEEFQAVSTIGISQVVDEIVVVDNNSDDRTAALAEEAGATVISEKKQGYGHALQRGLRFAQGDLIVLCEPDGTFVPKDLLKLLAYSEDFEMVCGTRTYPGLIWRDANMRWFLRLGNYFVAKFLEILYFTPSLSDCGCTFRLIHRKAADKIRPDLFVGQSHFLPNMVIAARANGVRFIEVPINYRGRIGVSKITGTLGGVWKTGLAMVWLIITLWPKFVWTRFAEHRPPAD